MSCGTIPVLPRVLEPKSYESQLPNARQGLLSVPCAALAIAVQTPGAQVQVRTSAQSNPSQSGGDRAEPTVAHQLKCDELLLGDRTPAHAAMAGATHAALPGAAHAAPRLPSSEPPRMADGLRPCGYLECPLVAYHPGPCQARVMPERRRVPKRPRSRQALPCVPDVLQPTEAEQAAFRAAKNSALEEAGSSTSNAADAADAADAAGAAVKEAKGLSEHVAAAVPCAQERSSPEPHARAAEQMERATESPEHETGSNGTFACERGFDSHPASAVCTDAPSLPSLPVRVASCPADTPVGGRLWREGAPNAHDASPLEQTLTATVGARTSSVGVTRVAQSGRGSCEAAPHAAPAAAGPASRGQTNASVSAGLTSHGVIGAGNRDPSSLAGCDCGSGSRVQLRGECATACFEAASCRSAALGMGGRRDVGGGAAFLESLERRVAAEAARAEATRRAVAQLDAAREEESALEAGHILQLLSVTQPRAKLQPRGGRQTQAAHGTHGAHGAHNALAADAPHARKKARPLPAALAQRRWGHDERAFNPCAAGSLAREHGSLWNRDYLEDLGNGGCDGSAPSSAPSGTHAAATTAPMAAAAVNRARVGTGSCDRAVPSDAAYSSLVGGRATVARRERAEAKTAASATGSRRAPPPKPAASHRAAHAARARHAVAAATTSAVPDAASASQRSLDNSSAPRCAHLDACSSIASASTSTSSAGSTAASTAAATAAANAGSGDASTRCTASAPKASAQRHEESAARTSSDRAQNAVERDAGIASRRSNSAGSSKRRSEEGAMRTRATRGARVRDGAALSAAGGHRARSLGRAGREGAPRSVAKPKCIAGDADGDGDSASGSGGHSNSGGGSCSGSSVRSVYGKGLHGLSKRLKGVSANEDGTRARAASPLCSAAHAAAQKSRAQRERATAAERGQGTDGQPSALSHAPRRSASRDAGARRGHTDSHTTATKGAGVGNAEQATSDGRGEGRGLKRGQGRGEEPADGGDGDGDDASEDEGPSLCGYLGCPLVAYHAGPCQVKAMPPRSRIVKRGVKRGGFATQLLQPNKSAADHVRDAGASHKRAVGAATLRGDGASARVAAAAIKQSKAERVPHSSTAVTSTGAVASATASDTCAGASLPSSAAVTDPVKHEAPAIASASQTTDVAERLPLPLESLQARQPVAPSAALASGGAGRAQDDGRGAAARSATAGGGVAAVEGGDERQSDGESTAGREGVDENKGLNKREDKAENQSQKSSEEIKANDDGKAISGGKSSSEDKLKGDGKSERQSSFRPCGYLGCPKVAYHAGPCIALVADRPRGRLQRTGCARCFWAADGCAHCGNDTLKTKAGRTRRTSRDAARGSARRSTADPEALE